MNHKNTIGIIALMFCLFILFVTGVFAQDEIIPFDSARWNLSGARLTEYLGRPCLMGTAFLKDVEF